MYTRAGIHTSRFVPLLRTALTAVALAAGMVAIPATAHAGVGISPVTIEFDNALRGAGYTSDLSLTNSDPDHPAEFTVDAVGDVATWISTTLDDDVPATSFVVPPDSTLNVRVLLEVPDDAPNRTYTGGLEVLGSVVEASEGAGVQIGGLVEIAVDVTGTESRSASVVDYRVASAEVGMEQRFTAIVQNEGNVQAIGQLNLTIVRDGTTVAELSSAGEPWVVQGGATGPVEVVWSTTEERPGDYTAVFDVEDVAGQSPVELGTREVPFSLEPIGTFTRSGELAGLSIVSDVVVDAPVVVEATFTNTGQIETNAVFEARLYRNDELVRVEQSLGRATPPGETVPIDARFEIDEPGPYRVEGIVNYDGFVTDTKSIDFEVGEGAPASTVGPVEERDNRAVAVVAVVAVLLLLLVGVLMWRRRWARRISARAGRNGIDYQPFSREAVKTVEAPSRSPLDDPWFDDLSEREFDPDALAAAMAELDAELGHEASRGGRRGGPE